MKFLTVLFSFCLLLACNKKTEQAIIDMPQDGTALTYLALGDSYTIGEAVPQQESFPFQLVTQLKTNNIAVAKPKVIAKTGWTTDELQTAIKAENIIQNYDIVTLLIGVNNQYRGYSLDTYCKEFKELLNTAISFAGKNKKRVFVVSIPDWGVTPFGKNSGRNIQTIASEIDAFNAIKKEETLAAGVSYTEITLASKNAATDLTLVAKDGLHPSGKMYAEWAAKVAVAVKASF
ncbi:SGNH/GDSL hydrolase family protein [Pedobacter cryotolerans]|uniref:SGNH/GDSL hydrolase family protein n=1 Tax=Pedobacter cryotolerans TaxID=2571270 RepID=A0A4U1CBS5_9SPHI|nr:SGNH/GDSL hydrolase family protein [Pedobacter cryotolerans]TKC03362.1 SGNH/GDSL hydrolase family protein [Pedobacter cryotolerans]